MVFSDTSVFEQSSGLMSRLRSLLPIISGLGMLCLIIALARPQFTEVSEKRKAEGIDIMLVMDVSVSMLAQDFQPNRLEVAKQMATEFVNKREFDRIGLVLFSGEAFTQSPLTTDHRVVNEYLEMAQPGTVSNGTAIGMGLATAVNRLKDGKGDSKVVILLTDGMNNAGYIQPQMASDVAKEIGVRVYTIGAGSNGKAYSPIGQRGDGSFEFGMTRVQIDEALLQRMATSTGGRYYRATNEEALREVYEEIDELEKVEIEVEQLTKIKELYRPWLLIGSGLILLVALLQMTFFRQIP